MGRSQGLGGSVDRGESAAPDAGGRGCGGAASSISVPGQRGSHKGCGRTGLQLSKARVEILLGKSELGLPSSVTSPVSPWLHGCQRKR